VAAHLATQVGTLFYTFHFTFHVFIVYLMTLTVAFSAWRRMTGWGRNNEEEMIWKEVAEFDMLPRNLLEGLRKRAKVMEARGSAVGLGTMLQAERPRVRFPIRLLDFSSDLFFPAALLPWDRLIL
jgi:hypothetical protein